MTSRTQHSRAQHNEALFGSGVNRIGVGSLMIRYLLLALLLIISIGPFIWQLSMSFKGPLEDLYSFPPSIIPADPTLANYSEVLRVVPVVQYAWHSLFVAIILVITNIVFSTMAGFALSSMRFRGKGIVMALLLSTLLLPGEVTLTSQYLTIKALGFDNTLIGVIIPTAVAAINVLLMYTACNSIPQALFDAAIIDGTTVWQRLRYVVFPNVRGMMSVVGLMSFIGAWDDFLWPLVVLSDPSKYTLTVGMQYLNSSLGSDPRVVAAGTIIALVPIIILFSFTQRLFFKGVEEGGVKG